MRFKTILGSAKTLRHAHKYRIDWEKKSRSKFQTRIKNIVNPYWSSHIVFEEFPVVSTRLSLDIYNETLKVAIEVQGRQHTKYVKFFHGPSKLSYLAQLKRDQDKFDFCEINGILLIEIHDEDDTCRLENFLKGEKWEN